MILTGDLNVAHLDSDIYNYDAKHIAKQAGCTPVERKSFGEVYLEKGEFIDGFRHFYPEAKGNFTYWSQRSGNRKVNRGLRLDYFICSPSLFDDKDALQVKDTLVLDEITADALIIALLSTIWRYKLSLSLSTYFEECKKIGHVQKIERNRIWICFYYF